jgi:hypothetical protein
MTSALTVDDLARINRANMAADFNQPRPCAKRHQRWLDRLAIRGSPYKSQHGWPELGR